MLFTVNPICSNVLLLTISLKYCDILRLYIPPLLPGQTHRLIQYFLASCIYFSVVSGSTAAAQVLMPYKAKKEEKKKEKNLNKRKNIKRKNHGEGTTFL